MNTCERRNLAPRRAQIYPDTLVQPDKREPAGISHHSMCCQLANGYMSPCPGVSLGQEGIGRRDTRPMCAKIEMHRRLIGALTDLANRLSVALSGRLSYFALETHCEKLTYYIDIY